MIPKLKADGATETRKTKGDDIYDKILAFHGRIVLPKGETGKDLVIAGRRF